MAGSGGWVVCWVVRCFDHGVCCAVGWLGAIGDLVKKINTRKNRKNEKNQA